MVHHWGRILPEYIVPHKPNIFRILKNNQEYRHHTHITERCKKICCIVPRKILRGKECKCLGWGASDVCCFALEICSPALRCSADTGHRLGPGQSLVELARYLHSAQMNLFFQPTLSPVWLSASKIVTLLHKKCIKYSNTFRNNQIYAEIIKNMQKYAINIHIHYLLIPQQTSNKKPRLASFTARPCDVTSCTSFLGPVSQKLIPAFVIQAIFSSRVTLVPSSGAKTLCFFVIIYRQPSNRNPIFRLLALVVVNIQKRHCENKQICGSCE